MVEQDGAGLRVQVVVAIIPIRVIDGNLTAVLAGVVMNLLRDREMVR